MCLCEGLLLCTSLTRSVNLAKLRNLDYSYHTTRTCTHTHTHTYMHTHTYTQHAHVHTYNTHTHWPQLALRAGNEKDADESADTVGCCSLRVEHISEFWCSSLQCCTVY